MVLAVVTWLLPVVMSPSGSWKPDSWGLLSLGGPDRSHLGAGEESKADDFFHECELTGCELFPDTCQSGLK